MPDHPVEPNPFSAPHANSDRSSDDPTNVPLSLVGVVRTGQLISVALAISILIIAGVFVFLVLTNDEVPKPFHFVFFAIGTGAFLLSLVVSIFLPQVLQGIARARLRSAVSNVELGTGTEDARARESNPLIRWETNENLRPALRKFAADNQTATLVCQATLQGAGVINLIFFLGSDHWLHLGLVAIAMVGILVQMPTMNKLRTRIESALDPREA